MRNPNAELRQQIEKNNQILDKNNSKMVDFSFENPFKNSDTS